MTHPMKPAPTCETCGAPLPGSMDWPAFAERLRIQMARDNLSLRELSALVGVDQATIHRLAKHAKPVTVEAFLPLWRYASVPTGSEQ